MEAFFIIGVSNELLMQRYYRTSNGKTLDSTFPLQCCIRFPSAQPMCVTHRGKVCCLITVSDVRFLSVSAHDYPVSLAFDILHNIADNISLYFGQDICFDVIKENLAICITLLDEMIDFGMPGTMMDANGLLMLVPPKSLLSRALDLFSPSKMVSGILRSVSPPSLLNAAGSAMSGHSITGFLPGDGMGKGSGIGIGSGLLGSGSSVWWRRGNASYLSDEVYVDVIEKINCIVDTTTSSLTQEEDTIISSDIIGQIDIRSRMSGIPRCQLVLANPEVLDREGEGKLQTFHPAVDTTRWESEQLIAFIPPDRYFTLCQYSFVPKKSIQPPLNIRANFTFPEQSIHKTTNHDCLNGKFEFLVTTNAMFTTVCENSRHDNESLILEQIRIIIPFPKWVNGATFGETTHGSAKFISNSRQNCISWSIARIVLNDNRCFKCEGLLNINSMQQHPSDDCVKNENAKDNRAIMTSYQNCIQPKDLHCVAQLYFWIRDWAVTGLAVDSLEVSNSSSAFKGVRRITSAGKVEFRL